MDLEPRLAADCFWPGMMVEMEDPGSVLVVEDEARVASSLVEAFESSGFVVSLCSTGFDALNYIEMEDDIAAVVTDIQLGEGPDGWEIARRAREHFPEAAVVYITGASSAAYGEKAVANSTLLQKPFPVMELVNTVSALLH